MAEPESNLGNLIASALYRAWRPIPPPLALAAEDLSRIKPLLSQSGAAGLVWARARTSDLKDGRAAQGLRKAFLSQVLQITLREHELPAIIACLRDTGIEPIVVKGWAIARLYPEKGLRPQGDIDLLIPPSEFAKAKSVLASPECEQYNVDYEHREFAKLSGQAIDALYSRSRLVSINDYQVRVLGPEDHLLFLCLHSLRHGAWRPLWLCDVAVELESRPSDFDWDLIMRDKRHFDCVASVVGLAHGLIGADIDGTPVSRRARRMPRWLVNAILRQWRNSDPMAHAPFNHLTPMSSYLRRPGGVLTGLMARWPDPIQATISVRGPFNSLPRFPFQVLNCLTRTAGFVKDLRPHPQS